MHINNNNCDEELPYFSHQDVVYHKGWEEEKNWRKEAGRITEWTGSLCIGTKRSIIDKCGGRKLYVH